jgi:Ca2+-binding EF-hand superfamily protein
MGPVKLEQVLAAGMAAVLCAVVPAGAVEWNEERAARALHTLDRDGSGTLTIEEFRSGARDGRGDHVDATFRHLDTNNDGQLSSEELREGWTRANNVLRKETWQRNDTSQVRIQEWAFDTMDADGDGRVSLEEFRAHARPDSSPGREFARADDDGDGLLTRREFNDQWDKFRSALSGAVLEPPAAPLALRPGWSEQAFTALDLNEDGTLTLAEFRAGMHASAAPTARAQFASLDANRNERLSRAEWRAGWPEVAAVMRDDLGMVSPALGVERREIIERRVIIEQRPAAMAADEALERLDTNFDGRLTVQEFQAGVVQPRTQATEMFYQMDTDRDGYVDRAELRASWNDAHMRLRD